MQDFDIIRTLYQHRRSSVYLATSHRKYGTQRVVIKETRLEGSCLEDRRLAIQEAHLLSRNRHPNIIKLLDFFERDESIFLVMEWAEYGDLSMSWKRLDIGEDFTMNLMVVLIQLLLALRHLHQNHIIHRDIKTKNILTGPMIPGSALLRIKLGDFGIARIVRTSANSMAKTMIGTPYYSSPEIFSGNNCLLTGNPISSGFRRLLRFQGGHLVPWMCYL